MIRPAAHWRSHARFALLPFATSRVICAAGAYLGSAQPGSAAVGANSGLANPLVNPWTPFDGANYLSVAAHGYSATDVTFFPLFPLILRIAGADSVRMAFAGVIFNSLCLYVAMILLREVATLDFGEPVANGSVWALGLFPTGFIFSSVYSDTLFLTLLLATFYLWKINQLWPCCIAALLASLTRNTGWVIGPALLLALIRYRDPIHSNRELIARCAAVIAPIAGLVGFELWLGHSFGNPFIGITAHQQFGRSLAWPWQPVAGDLGRIIAGDPLSGIIGLNLIALVASVTVAWHYRRRYPPEYAVLILGTLLMELVYARSTTPQLNGTLRFLSSLFPIPELLGLAFVRSAPRRWRLLQIGVGIAAAVVLFIFSFAWGQKSFVSG